MKFDFSHLEVSRDSLVAYALYQLDCPEGTKDRSGNPLSSPKLWIHPATEENKAYWKLVINHSGKNARRLRAGRIDPAVLEETREQDLKLFPIHVVKDWEGVFDTDGKPVPCTRENVDAFLRALPRWIFAEIRNFASEPTNFLPEETMGQEEAALAGEG